VVILELAAHGTYNFKRAKHILYIDAHGPFNEITTQQYAKDIDEFSYNFPNKNWTSLTTFYGDSIFTPAAENSLITLLRSRAEKGLLANACIILESRCHDLQYMQLKRIHLKANIAFDTFTDVICADKWLEELYNASSMIEAQ
jgi:hypothetical protein